MISACRDSSASRTEWLIPSAIMVSPRAITLPNGYSPSATPFLASSAQRAIIVRSVALALTAGDGNPAGDDERTSVISTRAAGSSQAQLVEKHRLDIERALNGEASVETS